MTHSTKASKAIPLLTRDAISRVHPTKFLINEYLHQVFLHVLCSFLGQLLQGKCQNLALLD